MRTGGFFFGLSAFLTGVVVGVGAGLLLAPTTGAETRRQLKELAGETGDHVSRIGSEARETFSDAVEQGKQAMHKAGGHIDKIRDEVKQTATGIVEKGKQLVG